MKGMRFVVVALTAAVLLSTANQSHAVWVNWDGSESDGAFTNAANWNLDRVPGDTGNGGDDEDNAVINNGESVTIDSLVPTNRGVFLGTGAANSGTLVIEAGGIIPWTKLESRIGQAGTGVVQQNGGSWNGSEEEMYLGRDPGSSGTWTMNGGTLSNCVMYIGNNNSSGRFELLGATASVEALSDHVYVGYTNYANGVVYQTNGVWNPGATRNIFLGYDTGATGTWQMTGGTVSNANQVIVGYKSVGRVELGGEGRITASASHNFVAKEAGSVGTVVQTGGVWDNNGNQIRIGEAAGATGTWQLSGGALTNVNIFHIGFNGVGTLEISNTGTLAGSTPVIAGSKAGSTGTVVQTGGVVSNVNQIILGDTDPSTGTYRISGGVITNVSQFKCGETGTGTLEIEGNEAAIHLTGGASFAMAGGDDTLRVILGETGITPIITDGNITLAGTLEVDLTNYDFSSSTLTLIDCGGVRSGAFTEPITVGPEPWSAEVSYIGQDVLLTNIKGDPRGSLIIIK